MAKIEEGTARVSLTIRTSTGMSIKGSVTTLPEDRALLIYKLYNGTGVGELRTFRVMQAIEKAREFVARGERNFSGLLDDIEKALDIPPPEPPKCAGCGTTENLHRDVGSGGPYRCDSPDCMVF